MRNPDSEEIVALEEERVKHFAANLSALWLTFVTFTALLVMTVGTVTHRQIFIEQPLKLPLLNLDLPLVAFFWAAPILFVVLHLYLLLQIEVLVTMVGSYYRKLQITPKHLNQEHEARLRLDASVFVRMLVSRQAPREDLFGRANRVVAWTTIVGLPLICLLQIQFVFLPFHDPYMTMFHRLVVVADAVIAGLFWSSIATRAARTYHRGYVRKTLRQLAPRFMLFALRTPAIRAVIVSRTASWLFVGLTRLRLRWTRALGLSVPIITIVLSFVAAHPSEGIYRLTEGATRPLFEGAIDNVRGRPNTWLYMSNRLILPDQQFAAAEKLPTLSSDARMSLSMRGRDLNGAILDRAELREVDFTGSQLEGASMQGAILTRARFDCGDGATHFVDRRCTNLKGAVLDFAHLQAASFVGAHLQGASMIRAELQGANLSRAQLQGAALHSTLLAGAQLDLADLRGANLNTAQLQGASLLNTRLEGASLDHAQMQGASLYYTQLQAASLEWAELQGATLLEADLEDAAINGIYTFRTRCELSEPVHKCTRLAPTLAKTSHQYLSVDRLVRPRRLSVPAINADRTGFEQFEREIVLQLPTERSKEEVKARLSILAPGAQGEDDDNKDVEFWKASALKSIDAVQHLRRRSEILRELACNVNAAPHVARRLVQNYYMEGPTKVPANPHNDPDMRECVGAKSLGSREAAQLRDWLTNLDEQVRR